MAPLVLEGVNLGERHKHYNLLLKEALEKQTTPTTINYDDPDVDNLIKIDTANKNKNVDYILEVFKSEDMLYVSRAIKNCNWLINDNNYSNLINPQYLYEKLFPFMNTKAVNKLLMHIRLHLKDEKRVEEFFDHIVTDRHVSKNAFKWLTYCSIPFIIQNVQKYANDIEMPLLKRLCKKGSIPVLESFMKKYSKYRGEPLLATIFLLNKETERYLDVVDKEDLHIRPNYGAKATDIIMKKCPQRVTDNFETYFKRIDIKSFAKHIKKEKVKEFVLVNIINNKKCNSLQSFDKLKYFIKLLPKEEQYPFLKQLIIDRTNNHGDDEPIACDDVCGVAMSARMYCAGNFSQSKTSNIYRWYRFAAFDLAFTEIKKLVRSESNPQERNAMLTELIYCAGNNIDNTRILLKYYLEKHVNEPFVFKIQFVNKVLSLKNAYSFDEKTWDLLNQLFYSLEVYNKSNNEVQFCLKSIIVHKILQKEVVPENVEKKFKFETLKEFQDKVSTEEGKLIFDYLYDFLINKIVAHTIANETQLQEAVNLLKSLQDLVSDWNKELSDFDFFFKNLELLLEIQKANAYDRTILHPLYDTNKTWRKDMFAYSFALHPTEEACLNALKHDPELLLKSQSELEVLFTNAKFVMKDMLSKLRIYWQQTLAQKWITFFLTKLDEEDDQPCLLRNLFKLLTHKQFRELILKHVPREQKINWKESDQMELGLCKNIAKNMYLARPQPPVDIILLYAKGDYLQFTLPSLCSVLYNMSSAKTREHLPKLLSAPISLQKHGLRLAILKLKPDESKTIFLDIWKSTKNLSIRAVIFESTFKLLCQQTNPFIVEEVWSMLNMFIDNLTQDDNKTIFELLYKANKVPETIRPQFCMKSYSFLKSLPDQSDVERVLRDADVMDKLDSEFVTNLFSVYLHKEFKDKYYNLSDILTNYLLSSKDDNTQTEKLELVLVPVLNKFYSKWDTVHENTYHARENLDRLLQTMLSNIRNIVLEKKMNIPVKLFDDILKNIESNLPLEDNYVLIRSWKLTYEFIKLLNDKCKVLIDSKEPEGDNSRDTYSRWEDVYLNITPDFGKVCHDILQEDTNMYYPSIVWLLSESINKIFLNMNLMNENVFFSVLKSMLCNEEFVYSYMLVTKLLPQYVWLDDKIKVKVNEICQIIAKHPSKEVRMHFASTFWNFPYHS